MSRSKKSRKPGSSSTMPTQRKSEKEALALAKDKRTRKKTGNKPGTRQNLNELKPTKQDKPSTKDPRIGSKKLIVLGNGASTEKEKTAIKTPKQIKNTEHKPNVAAIRVVESQDNKLRVELESIENDDKLQIILAKQEDEVGLTETEIDYFNELMARHEEISTQLGLDDEDELPIEADSPLSEDDLWDKFNETDFEGDKGL